MPTERPTDARTAARVPYLHVDHVSKFFPVVGEAKSGAERTVCIFRDVSLRMERGEFLTVIGHSGCGKSTLLNLVAGFERASLGAVFLEGREVTKPGLDRMVVFQNFALMPWLTALENVRVAVKAAHRDWPGDRVHEQARRYIELMGLGGAEGKRPAHLSGGMRQRVGIARAFSVEPKILLLDEPFAQIDALTRGVIQEELIRMWSSSGGTVLMVTHDVDEAILLSDRIALMTRGPEARLAEILPVDIPRPRTRAGLLDEPRYSELRAHILRFLAESEAPVPGQSAAVA
jgi:nitrate/nitrite transport system ATP-binding protein